MRDNKILLSYVPHGASKHYYPIDESSPDWAEYSKFKAEFKSKYDFNFAILFNSRNIRRKNPGDVILAYRRFCDGLPKDQSKRCVLIMKTAIQDENGTDLLAVKRAICPKYQVVFIADALGTQQMNWLYNMIDCTMFMSSAEGFGLAAIETLTVGKMLIAPVTGGLQDQMRFEDESGNWIDVNGQNPTNHKGQCKKSGDWAIPIFPTSRTLSGSIPTPFIFDDHIDSEDAAKAIRIVYDLTPEERIERGKLGRQWALSEESGMSAREMCNRFERSIDKLLDTWNPPVQKWELVQVFDRSEVTELGITWKEN